MSIKRKVAAAAGTVILVGGAMAGAFLYNHYNPPASARTEVLFGNGVQMSCEVITDTYESIDRYGIAAARPSDVMAANIAAQGDEYGKLGYEKPTPSEVRWAYGVCSNQCSRDVWECELNTNKEE